MRVVFQGLLVIIVFMDTFMKQKIIVKQIFS